VKKDNDIIEELKMLDSSLAEKPAKHSFQVPEGYFAAQEESISNFLFEVNDVQIAEEAFQVPKDYFSQQRESLQSELMKDKSAPQVKVKRLWRRIASVAAVLCLFAIGASLWNNSDDKTPILASLDDEIIMEYLGTESDMDELLYASIDEFNEELWTDLEIDDSSISSFLLESDDILINEYLDYE